MMKYSTLMKYISNLEFLLREDSTSLSDAVELGLFVFAEGPWTMIHPFDRGKHPKILITGKSMAQSL